MFLGRFAHTFDEKGRIAVPTKFRDLLSEGAYLTQGFDQNLMVWRVEDFEKLYKQVNSMSLTDPDARLLKRLIFSNAVHVDVDRVGRILIPPFLREAVNLNGNAIIVGVGDFFEIWSAPMWEQQNNQMQDSNTNARRFAALNLSLN
jgi:MraZ protein